METPSVHPGEHFQDPVDKCRQCRACTDCDEAQCLFYGNSDPRDCSMERCKYCTDFLKRGRIYLNNVG